MCLGNHSKLDTWSYGLPFSQWPILLPSTILNSPLNHPVFNDNVTSLECAESSVTVTVILTWHVYISIILLWQVKKGRNNRNAWTAKFKSFTFMLFLFFKFWLIVASCNYTFNKQVAWYSVEVYHDHWIGKASPGWSSCGPSAASGRVPGPRGSVAGQSNDVSSWCVVRRCYSFP